MAALIQRPDNGENYSVQARAPDDSIVYVIDDDADVREGVASLLQSVGLKSMIFKSAPEFLQKKPSENVSCLILDVRMPGLSGLDFQSELAKAQVSIPIIFITGFGRHPHDRKSHERGRG
jgi:FixJ family two-component response regulator